jgi:hypothetical protein
VGNNWATTGQQPPQNPNDPQRTRPAENRSRKSPNALKRTPGLSYGTAPRYDRRDAIPKVLGRPLAISMLRATPAFLGSGLMPSRRRRRRA